jgi:hypothetical protein
LDRIRGSSAAEYSTWYLTRDREKHPEAPDPSSDDDPVALMKELHGTGKWLPWFDEAHWTIVRLSEQEFRHLIFLDSGWTKEEGLTVPAASNHRLLQRVAENAIRIGYLERESAKRHRQYRDAMLEGFRMAGDHRVMLRTATARERAGSPDGTFYWMDGAGRGLPYMILLLERRLAYEPVEAFLAQPGDES